MKRRLLAILLTLSLLAAAGVCAGATLYLDTEGHWAESYIDEATSRGLFSGIDEAQFSPDTVMTRAMFVTVLGRTEGIDPEAYDTAFLADYFTDIDIDAYYAPYVAWAIGTGVTNGIGDGLFAPDAPVSREQMARFIHNYYLTVGILPAQADDAEAPAEDAEAPIHLHAERQVPETARTRRVGFAAQNETEAETEAPVLEEPVPETETEILPDEEHPEEMPSEIEIIYIPADFSDADTISDWAKESVDLLRNSGLFSGAPDGEGGYIFMPKKTATRAEGAVVFCKLQDLLAEQIRPEQKEVLNIVLNQDVSELEAGSSVQLSAMVFPLDASNQRVIWYSDDRSVLTVDAEGTVTGVSEGTGEVHARSSNGLEAVCCFTVLPAPEPDLSLYPDDLFVPTSKYDKCMLIFGQWMDDPRLAYSGDAEARQHMVTVEVPAWDIDANGEKYTRHFYLCVHENIKPIIVQVFNEIYALPEQVPIHSLGCYRWDGKCEHSIGLAVDINPAENYYCSPNGAAIVGKYFKPGEDPYSIPVGEAVDQIFEKYGFTRGIYWRNGYKDYMHYSYFGT